MNLKEIIAHRFNLSYDEVVSAQIVSDADESLTYLGRRIDKDYIHITIHVKDLAQFVREAELKSAS